MFMNERTIGVGLLVHGRTGTVTLQRIFLKISYHVATFFFNNLYGEYKT